MRMAISGAGLEVSFKDRKRLERWVLARLGLYKAEIREVSIALSSCAGFGGLTDTCCRISAELVSGRRAVAEATAGRLERAAESALSRAALEIARELGAEERDRGAGEPAEAGSVP